MTRTASGPQGPSAGRRPVAAANGAPQRILSQGAHGNAYVRRPGRKAAAVGRIDYHARGATTAGAKDRFVVETTAGHLTVEIEVADTQAGTPRYLNAESGDGGNKSLGGAWKA